MTKEEFFAEFDRIFDELNNVIDLLFSEETETEKGAE